MTKWRSAAGELTHSIPRDFSLTNTGAHYRGEHNGHRYDDDIIIDTRRKSVPSRRRSPSRHRSPSSNGRSRYDPVAEEAEYYARKTAERAYIGEAYNGATKDWAIVDVPPGTTRVRMNGIGGAAEEVTWQRYNGVRRSKFIPEDDGYEREEVVERVEERGLDKGRRFVGMKPKTETMWTEITKDLVIKEAIERLGYDYEETEFFFYVMEYLRYVSASRPTDHPLFSTSLGFSPPIHLANRSFLHRKTSCASSKSPKTSAANAVSAFAKSSGSANTSRPLNDPDWHSPPSRGMRNGSLRGRSSMIAPHHHQRHLQ